MTRQVQIRLALPTAALLAVQAACVWPVRRAEPRQQPAEIGSSASPALTGPDQPLPRRASDLLTAAQIASIPGLENVYADAAVRRLRPEFLAPRDLSAAARAAGRDRPAVFVNGASQGGIEALRGIPVRLVVDIVYMQPIDALQRYGPAYSAGVILVRTRP